MDITEEQKEEIIALAVERALLRLPYAMGSLIDSHFAMLKMNKEFYERNKDLAEHKNIVASVVEEIDNQNTLLSYEEKLKKAVPEIRRRIGTIKMLDMQSADKPKRETNIESSSSNNGEL